MIEQICAHIHNYFDMDEYRRYWHRETGEFTIANGALSLPFLLPGQYFRIDGSRFNDGVHQYPADDLQDETFTGAIYEMRPKRAFLQLCADIEAWQEKNGAAAAGPYQSESFGGYSYTLAGGNGNNGEGLGAGWQNSFRTRLDPWRKIS